MSRHTLDRSTASSDRYSTASSTGGNSDGGRLSEPLINPVGAGGSALEPLLYAAVICEGILLAEGALVEPSAVPALRAAALKMEKGLQRAVSFCSQIERVPRMMATVPLVTIHTLKRHGHAFVVIALTAFEAELASRLCEEAYELCERGPSEGDVRSRVFTTVFTVAGLFGGDGRSWVGTCRSDRLGPSPRTRTATAGDTYRRVGVFGAGRRLR